MPWDWEACVKQGEESFEYMVNHFHDMFKGEGEEKRIKELSMGYTDTYTNIYYEKIADEYYEEFEKLLVPWIYQEFESKRLLERSQWKLFRDAETFIDICMGYRKLFLHKHYYFQLTIASYNRYDSITKDNIYFELNLYGWKEENSDLLYPIKRVSIPLDMMMPDLDWK
jgi:hypothetical protein